MGRSRDHTPLVSVIVPARNEARTIGECLAALVRLNYPVERREILVVDNASTDRTAEIIGRYPVRRLREERRGAAAARNLGIEASRGEILAFLDADCVPTTTWLRALVEGFDSEAVGVVSGEIVAHPPRTAAERYTARRRPLVQGYALSYPGARWFSLANVAFRRVVFAEIGLLDSRFAGAEDIDVSWRFFKNGRFALRYQARALVLHHNHVAAWGLFRRSVRYGRGQAMLWRKYPDEQLWSWRRELPACADLVRTATGLGLVAIRSSLTGRGATDRSWRYFELVRKLGERVGFIRGALAGSGRAA